LNQGVGLADSAHHPDPTIPFESASSSIPDLLSSAVDQEHGPETSLTSTRTEQPASTNSQPLVSDWKATAKEGLGVASRFAQTLLKKLPGCVDTNPVKMAFSIAKAIIEMKEAVGDNKDELAQRLEETANRLMAVERTVAIGVPKAAEQEMEKLKQYVAFRAPKSYHKEHVTIQDPWGRNEENKGPRR